MNTQRVNAAAGVLHASMQQGKSLPQALAYGLEAAGLLQSPETAAELVRLREFAEASAGRYAELEVLLSRLDAAEDAVAWDLGASVVAILTGPGPRPGELVEEVRSLRARVAELEAERSRPAPVVTRFDPREADEYRFCGADLGRSEFPFTCNRRIAHKGMCGGQLDPAPVEASHEGPEPHAYRLGRDLPEARRG